MSADLSPGMAVWHHGRLAIVTATGQPCLVARFGDFRVAHEEAAGSDDLRPLDLDEIAERAPDLRGLCEAAGLRGLRVRARSVVE